MIDAVFAADAIVLAVRLVGYALLAASCAALAAFVYRNRIAEDLPETAALIVGLGVVAIYLNTRLVLIQFVGDNGNPLTIDSALANLAIFAVAALAAMVGRTAGHRVAGMEKFAWTVRSPGLSPIVRATGRFITVTLPTEIEDINGYDPVPPETKEAIAGKSFDFQRGLTLEEIEEQLTVRLTKKHEIGYVDIDLDASGAVTYLAVGQGPAGLGETLAPGMAAVAIRADPPFSASPGDTIEIWRGGDTPESLGMGELRAAIGDVVTVACDRAIARSIDPTISYRIMTHAADQNVDREFVTILRHSPETMSVLEVGPDTPLVRSVVGALEATVLAVQRDDTVETIPGRDYRIKGGDRLYLLGRPDRIRQVEAVAGVTSISLDSTSDGPSHWALRPGGGSGEVRDGR